MALRLSRSRIARDPEVAAFVAERVGCRYLREIEDECRERFGAARTPSTKAIWRFFQRLKAEAAARR